MNTGSEIVNAFIDIFLSLKKPAPKYVHGPEEYMELKIPVFYKISDEVLENFIANVDLQLKKFLNWEDDLKNIVDISEIYPIKLFEFSLEKSNKNILLPGIVIAKTGKSTLAIVNIQGELFFGVYYSTGYNFNIKLVPKRKKSILSPVEAFRTMNFFMINKKTLKAIKKLLSLNFKTA